jgi:hypothetical protein
MRARLERVRAFMVAKAVPLAYVLVTASIALYMHRASASAPPSEERKPMTTLWKETTTGITIPARPKGIWTLAHDFVEGPAVIKVEAVGTWSYTPGVACEADGDLNGLLNGGALLVPGAPVGSLVAKVGGSSAGDTDGVVRVIGQVGYITLDAKTSGPVFLTINDDKTGLRDNAGQLTVTISIRKPTPTPTPKPAPKDAPEPDKAANPKSDPASE